MIIGHLNALPLAGLPSTLYALLSRPTARCRRSANAMTGAGSRKMQPGFARLVRRRRSHVQIGIRSTIASGPIFRLYWQEKNIFMLAHAPLASRRTKSVNRISLLLHLLNTA